MGIQTEKYIRKPLYVDAVRVTDQNFDEICEWVSGKVENEGGKKFVRVFVKDPKVPRQTKAFVGDWILWTERGGYKVYTPKAFKAAFDPVTPEPPKASSASENDGYAGDGVVITTPATSSKGQPNDGLTTPQGEPIEVVPATAQAIADVVNEQQPVHDIGDGTHVADTSTSPPPVVDGKRVLTLKEQTEMTHSEVTDLLRSGEAILEQDIAA